LYSTFITSPCKARETGVRERKKEKEGEEEKNKQDVRASTRGWVFARMKDKNRFPLATPSGYKTNVILV
jgi:hypothetical protein